MAGISRSNLEEVDMITKWCNQMLSRGGHGDVLVTDLASDLADGVVLIKLLQVALGVSMPQFYATPIMRAQKLQNLQLCLNAMYDHHISVSGIQADALLAGDLHATLAACNALKTYSEDTRDDMDAGWEEMEGNSGDSDQHSPTLFPHQGDPLLKWVGSVISQNINSYSQLYDGQILCQLVNSIHPGAISAMELSTAAGSSSASVVRLRLVNEALKEYLLISSTFDPEQVADGQQKRRLKYVLQQCRKALDQKMRRREIATRTNKTTPTRSSMHESSLSQPLATKDIYLQGASSYTDLSTRRAEHDHMIRGGVAAPQVRKHSSSEVLGTGSGPASYGTGPAGYGTGPAGYGTGPAGYGTGPAGYGTGPAGYGAYRLSGSLDRVQSMESVVHQHMAWHADQEPSLARASSHSALQHTIRPFSGSTENIRTSLHNLQPTRRAPSLMRLDSSDHMTQQMNILEEKMSLLARQFLHARLDMYKQIMRTLIKERRKRQAAERRLQSLERKSRDLMRHYDHCIITLAKQVEELRSDVCVLTGRQGPTSTTLSREIQELQIKSKSRSSNNDGYNVENTRAAYQDKEMN